METVFFAQFERRSDLKNFMAAVRASQIQYAEFNITALPDISDYFTVSYVIESSQDIDASRHVFRQIAIQQNAYEIALDFYAEDQGVECLCGVCRADGEAVVRSIKNTMQAAIKAGASKQAWDMSLLLPKAQVLQLKAQEATEAMLKIRLATPFN